MKNGLNSVKEESDGSNGLDGSVDSTSQFKLDPRVNEDLKMIEEKEQGSDCTSRNDQERSADASKELSDDNSNS